MPEAIRSRLPTEDDSDHNLEVEAYTSRNGWQRMAWEDVIHDQWWRPIDQTPPEPQKPNRKTHSDLIDGVWRNFIEVLPGDPPDLDEFIEQAVRMFELTNPLIELDEQELGRVRMRFDKARHGEGGEK